MTERKLKNLLKKFSVPPHIMAHMEKVAMVAGWIAEKLIVRGYKVKPVVLRQACLLHDLLKVCEIRKFEGAMMKNATPEDLSAWKKVASLYSKEGHIDSAVRILSGMGEDGLAQIILKHRFESLIDADPSARPSSWEEKLLYYADKRVKHDKIVTIRDRLEDGRKRYFGGMKIPKNNSATEKAVYAIEKEICDAAGINPGQINEKTFTS